jgi:excinuclease UvrABC nuclease subunit
MFDPRTVVYQVIDALGVRLYVGRARRKRWPRRFWEHVKKHRGFVDKTARVEITDHASRREALAAEAYLIQLYRPRYNYQRPGPPAWISMRSGTGISQPS